MATKRRSTRRGAQAAQPSFNRTEYKRTYGWLAVLVVSLVFAGYEFSTLSNNVAIVSNGCVSLQSFQCNKPSLDKSGTLWAVIGQNSGTNFNVTGVACINQTTLTPSSFQPISFFLPTGSYAVVGFSCPLSTDPYGLGFTGTLWIQYNTTSAANNVQSKLGAVDATP